MRHWLYVNFVDGAKHQFSGREWKTTSLLAYVNGRTPAQRTAPAEIACTALLAFDSKTDYEVGSLVRTRAGKDPLRKTTVCASTRRHMQIAPEMTASSCRLSFPSHYDQTDVAGLKTQCLVLAMGEHLQGRVGALPYVYHSVIRLDT